MAAQTISNDSCWASADVSLSRVAGGHRHRARVHAADGAVRGYLGEPYYVIAGGQVADGDARIDTDRNRPVVVYLDEIAVRILG